MKTTGILTNLLAASVLLMPMGCSLYTKTNFSQYRGPSDFRGDGGTVRNIDGIDVWKTGTPDRKCRILGVIQQTHVNNHSFMSLVAGGSKDSAIIKEAKSAGGDAIVVLSNISAITGYTTHSSIQASGSDTAYGTSHTSADTTTAKVVVVLKYLD